MQHLRLPAASILNIAEEVIGLLELVLAIDSRSNLLAGDRQLKGFLEQGANDLNQRLIGLVARQFHIRIGPDALAAGALATVDSLVDCVFSRLG